MSHFLWITHGLYPPPPLHVAPAESCAEVLASSSSLEVPSRVIIRLGEVSRLLQYFIQLSLINSSSSRSSSNSGNSSNSNSSMVSPVFFMAFSAALGETLLKKSVNTTVCLIVWTWGKCVFHCHAQLLIHVLQYFPVSFTILIYVLLLSITIFRKKGWNYKIKNGDFTRKSLKN